MSEIKKKLNVCNFVLISRYAYSKYTKKNVGGDHPHRSPFNTLLMQRDRISPRSPITGRRTSVHPFPSLNLAVKSVVHDMFTYLRV